MKDLDNTINHPEITDICKTLLPTTEYTFFFFSSIYGTSPKIDRILPLLGLHRLFQKLGTKDFLTHSLGKYYSDIKPFRGTHSQACPFSGSNNPRAVPPKRAGRGELLGVKANQSQWSREYGIQVHLGGAPAQAHPHLLSIYLEPGAQLGSLQP